MEQQAEEIAMHGLGTDQEWDPFPPAREDDTVDRRSANRAVGFSAIGLGVTGLVELGIAILSGSVGLLGESLGRVDILSGVARVQSVPKTGVVLSPLRL